MKFNYLYNLIYENKIDDLIVADPSLAEYERVLKEIYRDIPISIKSHNKFGKFLELLVLDPGSLSEYKGEIEHLFKLSLKYNIDVDRFQNISELSEYIENKEDIVNYVFDDNVKKIYEDEEKYVLRVWNFEGMKKYGSHFWCIAKDEKMWYEYILRAGKNNYLVLYKSNNPVIINTYDMHKASIQVNLDNKIYITDYENRMSMGITGNEAAIILKEMKVAGNLFKSYKEDEDIEIFIKKNDKWLKNMSSSDKKELKEILVKVGFNVSDVYNIEDFRDAIFQNNYKELARFVNNKEFDINVELDQERNTGLILASISDEYLELLKLLLSRSDINVNVRNIYKRTAFLQATIAGNVKIVQEFLKRKDVDIYVKDFNGRNALFTNSPEVLKLLLTQTDINVNEKDIYRLTAYDRGNERKKQVFKQLNKVPNT